MLPSQPTSTKCSSTKRLGLTCAILTEWAMGVSPMKRREASEAKLRSVTTRYFLAPHVFCCRNCHKQKLHISCFTAGMLLHPHAYYLQLAMQVKTEPLWHICGTHVGSVSSTVNLLTLFTFKILNIGCGGGARGKEKKTRQGRKMSWRGGGAQSRQGRRWRTSACPPPRTARWRWAIWRRWCTSLHFMMSSIELTCSWGNPLTSS